MSLEFYCLIASALSLGLVIPVALRAHERRAPHRYLCSLCFLCGYTLLLVVFLVDAAVAMPLSPLLRFTRGFTAGLAIGLVLSGVVVLGYDAANYRAAERDTEK
jgi:hypothetical protein